MQIRPEIEADYAVVQEILLSAFEADGESRLVTGLRANAQPTISLIAEQAGKTLGHILFSPVTLDSKPKLALMGLAPMAVRPDNQGRGIGTALVEAGLDRCRETQVGAVVVLGHPEYYPRFGFRKSTDFDIESEYGVPVEAFMLLELQAGYLDGHSGVVQYHDEFKKL